MICEKEYIKLQDGKMLYTELYNSGHDETLLIIHGGPGESCIGFSYFALILSESINVLSVDQRGVLRSDFEDRKERLTINQLILDFEELRKRFKIKKWFIMGHSFGGYIALRYAILFPQSIKGIIFENPCLNIPSSIQEILQKYKLQYDKTNEVNKKEKILQLMKSKDIVAQFRGIMELPEIDRKHIFCSEAISMECKLIYDPCNITKEMLQKSQVHFDGIQEDESLYDNYYDEFIKLPIDGILIHSSKDPMLSEYEKNQWNIAKFHDYSEIMDAGHYIHSDKPKELCELIRNFISKY